MTFALLCPECEHLSSSHRKAPGHCAFPDCACLVPPNGPHLPISKRQYDRLPEEVRLHSSPQRKAAGASERASTRVPAAGVHPGYAIGRDGNGLTQREREVLAAFGEGLNLVDTGAKLGVSKQRVLQIAKALEGKGALSRDGDKITITSK